MPSSEIDWRRPVTLAHPSAFRLAIGLIIGGMIVTTPCIPAGLTIVDKGRSDYVIVLAQDAILSERFAADELALHIREMSGATVKIVTDAEPLPTHAIVLGTSRHLADLRVAPDWKRLGKEGYLLRTIGDRLIIAGGKPRGALYGVYHLLENLWGCRWFTFDTNVIPKKPTLRLPDLNVVHRPVFELRDVSIIADGSYGAWFPHNRNDRYVTRSHWNFRDRDWRNKNEVYGGNFKCLYGPAHNYRWLVDPDVYAAEHPEYYALDGGKRQNYIMPGTYAEIELCLTNPGAAQAAAKFLTERLREYPDADMVFVGQSDTPSYCKCDDCNAARRKYGGWDSARRAQIPANLPEDYWNEYGGFAGWQLQFVNRIAEALEKEFPRVRVGTFAYWHQRHPPRGIKAHRNVVIWYCPLKAGRTTQRCYDHSVDSGPVNRDFENFPAELSEWKRIASHVFVYDYWLGTWWARPVNIPTLSRTMRFYRKSGVEGVLLDGVRGVPGGFEWLTFWLWCQLAWNPDFDARQGIDDFCAAYYGAAAPYIKQYIDLACLPKNYEMTSRPDIYAQSYSTERDHTKRFTDDPYTPIKLDKLRNCLLLERMMKKEALDQGYRIFEQARKAVADDPKAAKHVEYTRMALQYAMLEWLPGSDPRLKDEVLLLIRLAKELEIPCIGHNAMTYDQYREAISRKTGKAIPAE